MVLDKISAEVSLIVYEMCSNSPVTVTDFIKNISHKDTHKIIAEHSLIPTPAITASGLESAREGIF